MIEPPLPFGSAAGRWYYVLLKGLVERGHRVTAFTTCSNPDERAETRRLFPEPAFDLRLYVQSLANHSPARFTAVKRVLSKWQTLRQPYGYMFHRAFREDLRKELSRGFDVLHLEQLWSGWLGLDHVRRALLNIHYLYAIDLAGVPAGTPLKFARRLRTRQSERYLLRSYPTICTLTPCLSDHVHQLAPGAAIHTVPLGIDLSLYPPLAPRPVSAAPVVSLIGSFHWQPSISAAVRLLTRLWPEIKCRVPEARLQIVGRQARTALSQFLELPDVTIEQDVADIMPYFRAADVLLYAPHEGSGMKVKVLEAFALGVPVVTNRAGVEGIPAEDGVHAGLCEVDEGLIQRTVALLRQNDQREQQRRAARALVEVRCNPTTTLTGIEQVYESVIADSRLEFGMPTCNRPAAIGHQAPLSWRRDIAALAVCVFVGVSLSILPHVLWWPWLGAPVWIADNDDLLYLSYAAQAYDNHPARLADPVLARGGAAMYPWLQFVPGLLLARALHVGPMAIDLIWRAWAGVSIALAWYLVIRWYMKSPLWSAVAVVGMLADTGLLTGHLFIRQCLVSYQVLSGQTAELLANKPIIHEQWRIITPGLSLMFLLIYLWSLSRVRREPSGSRCAHAGLAFGLLFYVYFYYWTAALLGLCLAAILEAGHRRIYVHTAWIGGLLGIPAVISGYLLKHSGLSDWSLRNDYFLPIFRFSELLIPKLAIAVLVAGLVWVWLRRRDLLHLWALAAAGLLLANHQVATSLQINNFHWSYVWGPAVSLLLVLLVAGEVRHVHWRPAAAWTALFLAGGHLAAGFWLRGVEATHSRESVELAGNYQKYSSQRLGALCARLAPNAVLGGEKSFVDLAAIMENQRPLYHYAADLSPAVSNDEWNQRIALNAFLRGVSERTFAVAQKEAVAEWVLGPWPRDPARQAELFRARLACYTRVMADPNSAVEKFGVRYVALAADRSPPAYPRSDWNCIQKGPYWSLWERRPMNRECTGY
jgi:glycosyltransferase involved in cell wall biosynthesis